MPIADSAPGPTAKTRTTRLAPAAPASPIPNTFAAAEGDKHAAAVRGD
jgi:hypothetical protein